MKIRVDLKEFGNIVLLDVDESFTIVRMRFMHDEDVKDLKLKKVDNNDFLIKLWTDWLLNVMNTVRVRYGEELEKGCGMSVFEIDSMCITFDEVVDARMWSLIRRKRLLFDI